MDPEFKLFLQERNIDVKVISHLEEHKIDPAVIVSMDKSDLVEIFPLTGDRVEIQRYCKEIVTNASKKSSFLENLKNKLRKNKKRKSKELSSSEEDNQQETRAVKTSNREKGTRMVYIGWVCSENGNRHAQVRANQGGGRRRLEVPKKAHRDYILEKGKSLFFPNGVSPKGRIEEFSFQLWNFQQEPIDETLSTEDMYRKTGLPILRFYVASTKRTSTITTSLFESEKPTEAATGSNSLEGTNEYEKLVAEAVLPDSLSFSSDLQNQSIDYEILTGIDSHISNEMLLYDLQEDGQAEVEESLLTTKLSLHRGQVMDELIKQFMELDKDCPPLQIEMHLPNGQKEQGFDTGGVLRDTFSEFWSSFYERCTEGTDWKVPFIRHDFDEAKWQAVAKIFYRGWKDVKYFPVKLAKPFVEYCILEKITSDLKTSFFLILSSHERNIINEALSDFVNADQEALLDILDNYQCKVRITSDNLEAVLKDLAHKEIIQKPKYVIDCWAKVLKNLMTTTTLERVYAESIPSAKNVLPLLTFNASLNEDEKKVVTFLKRYIRDSTEVQLSRFLRFCTGADVITDNHILVSFSSKQGLERTPTASTCACILDLPVTYDNFAEFRTEFNSILDSNMWVMDFV